MENRKSLKSLIFIFVFVFILGIAPRTFAYEAETHAYLTTQVINLYDQYNSNNPIKEELIPYILDGSRREDDTPRYMNHFYDPVYDRGLDDPEWGGGFSSKDWAQSDSKQATSVNKPISFIASILDVSEQANIKDMDVNFTWQQALRYYRDGEKEKAMFALGHVIHLVEDASVPDHTRNDGHPSVLGDSSPYEKYTSKFTIDMPDSGLVSRLASKKPFDSMPTLSNYFDELARYSNNNFYSADTLGLDVYSEPNAAYSRVEGKYKYEFRSSSEFGDYKLAIVVSDSLNATGKKILTVKGENDSVLTDYWSRLSVKSIQVSAGVIKLFFDDVARVEYGDVKLIRDDRSPISWIIDNTTSFAQIATSFGRAITSSVSSTANSFLAQAVDAAKEFVSSVVDTVKDDAQIPDQNLLASIPLEENNNAIQSSEQEIIGTSSTDQSVGSDDDTVINIYPSNESDVEELVIKETEIVPEQDGEQKINEDIVRTAQDQLSDVSEVNNIQEQASQVSIVAAQTCSFQTSKIPTYQNLLINEVAWMGGLKSANDEWIELRNISGSDLDISNWQVLDKEEQIKVIFPKDTKIYAGGFLLLERTDDNSVPNVKADFVYTGSLSNSNEALRLFNNECGLIDEVFANSEWVAGEAATKRTMERQTDLGWWTYSGAGEGSGDALILGTPKKENTIKVIHYGGSGTVAPAPIVQQSITEGQQQSPVKILISEIRSYPAANRFIELYNPSDSSVDLTNWYIQRKTQTGSSFSSLVSKTYFEGKIIGAHGYFVISRNTMEGADIVLDSLTLTESNVIQLKNSNGDVADKAGWGGANDCEGGVCAAEMINDQSIQRKIQNNSFVDTDNNAGDFEIQNCPSPKSQTRSCQTSENLNQAPSAFFDLSISEPKVNEEIIFNAASSTDPDGNIASYEWNFGDGAIASSTQATTTHLYAQSGTYKADLIVYDNENATSTVSRNITVIESANKPAKVSNFLAQYDKADKEIDFSWNESVDHLGATSTLIYKIKDISESPILGTLTIASSTIATTSVSELGRDYIFSIEAIDNTGLSSDISTANVSVPANSIEDVNYYILKQDQVLSSSEEILGQVFKPLAEGVIGSVTLNLSNSVQHGDSYGSSDVNIGLYEWTSNSATTSPNIGRGQLLATSSVRGFYAGASGNYTWDFDHENQVVLDSTKYYYIQVNIIPTHGNLSLIWGLSSASNASEKSLYTIVKAIESGDVIIKNPVNNYIYQNTDINFTAKYSEPFKNKYSNLVVDVRDFYTEELVSSQTVALSDTQKTIGWHEISGNLNLNRPGYFKLKISLSDLIKLESYFSVFGAVPAEGKLLDQTAFVNNLSVDSIAQTFRPMVSGGLDSITLKLATGGNGWNYTSLKIYEWIGGQPNVLDGNKGQLLATSESKEIWNNFLPGEGGDLTWQFNDENEINLSSDNYYYLESTIDSQSNGGAPSFFFRGSNNDSLIDGGMYAGNIGGDLYLIINAVPIQ